MTSSPGGLLPARHKTTDRSRSAGWWAVLLRSGSHLVLRAGFGRLRDFAPSGPRGLFHPGYGHGWLLCPLKVRVC